MRQKEQLINHGVMRLLLFALVTLMPIGACKPSLILVAVFSLFCSFLVVLAKVVNIQRRKVERLT